MKVAIVGHEAAKFLPEARIRVADLLDEIVGMETIISGRCHLGGVDVWAEEYAIRHGNPTEIYPPKTRQWSTGYKPRNLQIAQACDEIHVIVVDVLPPGWKGLAFSICYHCNRVFGEAGRERSVPEHVKSGACWTAHEAIKLGKPAFWHVIKNYP